MGMKLMNIMLLAVLAITAAQSVQSDPTQKFELLEENDERMKLGGLPLLKPAKPIPAKTMAAMRKVKELENALTDLDSDLASNTRQTWGKKHTHHKHHPHKHTPCVLYISASKQSGGDRKKTWEVRKSVCQKVPFKSGTLRTIFQTGCKNFGTYSYDESKMGKKCFNACKKYTDANEKNACVDGCDFVYCSSLSLKKRGCAYANPKWDGSGHAKQPPGCGGSLVPKGTWKGKSVSALGEENALDQGDLENDLEDDEETSWSKKKPAGKCVKVCYKDGCKGTWSNPISKGQQWKRKGGYVGSGCCNWGAGRCDNCCPP